MTDTADTIELLEAIGSDASLRYAQGNELMGVLEQAQASAEFTAAVAAGNSTPLRMELGIHQVPQAQQTQSPGHDEDEDECDTPQPQREGTQSQPQNRHSSY